MISFHRKSHFWSIRLALLATIATISGRSADASVVQFRVEVVDDSGVPISEVAVNDTFQLLGWVQDVREESTEGIFAAYADVTFDSALATPTGPLDHGAVYRHGVQGVVSNDGLIDEVGGIAGLDSLGGAEFLLFRLPFQATTPGNLLFVPEPADNLPDNDTLAYGLPRSVTSDEMLFAGSLLSILGGIGGDADGNGTVDLSDFNALKAGFGNATLCPSCDFNGDLAIDLNDFNILKANFGQSPQAAPEPSTVVLGVLAIGALSSAAAIRSQAAAIRWRAIQARSEGRLT